MSTEHDHTPDALSCDDRLTAALREARGGTPAGLPSETLRSAVVARLDELEACELRVATANPRETRWRRYVLWGAGGLALSMAGCVVGVSALVYGTNLNWRMASAESTRLDVSRSKIARSTSMPFTGSDEFRLDEIRLKKDGESASSRAVVADLGVPTEVTIPPDIGEIDVATAPVKSPQFDDRLSQAGDSHRTTVLGSGVDGRGAATRAALLKSAGGSAPAHSPDGYRVFGRGENFTTRVWRQGRHVDELQDLPKSREIISAQPGEQYDAVAENPFLPVDKATALSTFSIDVDTASYANVRRFLSQNQLPPPNAVRIEEMLNYFRYSYPQPQGNDPFSVNMELADCPWQPGHQLLRIGLKGKEVHVKERKPGNLVFLVDVSGSMQPENRLPLLKQAFKMLVGELTENDKVTIVTYAGEAGLKLDATNGTRQNEIRAAIDSLGAGGSTHGSAGIELAYQKAAQNFIKDGTNRVILATDGDLNVGITSDSALVDLIKTKAAGGVFLTVLGVGEGNLKDSKMEKLADNGNGVYAYLDSLREARKVLVEQLSGSLETIAKDVKLQIEFNPAEVASYRLVGYENRLLAERDFHDDKKDAGEIGAGHTVTALYELVPTRARAEVRPDAKTAEGAPLKYQKAPEPPKVAPEALTPAAATGEVLTLKLRFKQPDAETSVLCEYPLKSEGGRFNQASADMQFAAAVASFGMLLKGSQHRGDATFSAVEEIAAGAIGPDAGGYRAEFLDLVRKAKTLAK